jgi:hypothetical protein
MTARPIPALYQARQARPGETHFGDLSPSIRREPLLVAFGAFRCTPVSGTVKQPTSCKMWCRSRDLNPDGVAPNGV